MILLFIALVFVVIGAMFEAEVMPPVDIIGMSLNGKIDSLVELEHMIQWSLAQQARLLASVAADRGNQALVREEVRLARRWSDYQVCRRFDTSEALVGRLSETLESLESGGLSYPQAEALATAVRDLDDEFAREIESRVLPKGPEQSQADFRRDLRKSVHAVDPRGQEAKRRVAEGDRKVTHWPEDNAMATVQAMLTARVRRRC